MEDVVQAFAHHFVYKALVDLDRMPQTLHRPAGCAAALGILATVIEFVLDDHVEDGVPVAAWLRKEALALRVEAEAAENTRPEGSRRKVARAYGRQLRKKFVAWVRGTLAREVKMLQDLEEYSLRNDAAKLIAKWFKAVLSQRKSRRALKNWELFFVTRNFWLSSRRRREGFD